MSIQTAAIPANFNGAKPVIDPDTVAMLLIDHQSGLFQTVQDMPFTTLRRLASTLAKIASLAKIPVITTASVPQGPNGPLIPEIHGENPDAVYIPRTGQINACSRHCRPLSRYCWRMVNCASRKRWLR